MSEFDVTIKRIEQELLDLKTAAEYSSTRSASFGTADYVSTGLYHVTYAPSNEAVIAFAYCDVIQGADVPGFANPRTPTGNTQVFEVNTNYWDFDTQQTIVGNAVLHVISNRTILSIERID